MKDTGLVITGIGIVSPLGIGKENFWRGLCEGKNCIREITLFDTKDFAVKKACEITDFNPLDFIEKRHLRTLDRSTRLLIAATQLALEDANIEINEGNTNDIGIAVGATFGSLHSICTFDREGLVEGPKYVNPSFFPNTVINSPAGHVSIKFKIKGFNTTVSNGFCASSDAFIYASDFLRIGRASISLVSGVEELCKDTFTGFYQLNLLSGSDGTEPFSAPFDRRRNGLVLSEGASVIVLETEQNALNRSVKILAKVISYASFFTAEANGKYNSGSGLKKAILSAIRMAELTPGEIDLVFSSANGTKELDLMESQVLYEIFSNKIPVTAIKSTMGEAYSASGAIMISAAIETLQTNLIPPTMNLTEPDKECKINIIREKNKEHKINNILIICSDPFGNNTAIIIGRYEK